LVIHLVLPPVIAEMCNQDKTGRLKRTLRSYSTLYGVPSVLFLTVFMLLGGQILGLVCGGYYRNGAGILILLSAAKVADFCSGFCGLVFQMTGYHKQMLPVNRLTRLLFIFGSLLVV
jgi:O-antigen/teichoic acid export membrane protein